MQDLPPLESCDMSFPEGAELLALGKVSHITEEIVVIQSLPATPPVDEGTVLWNQQGKSLSVVSEGGGRGEGGRETDISGTSSWEVVSEGGGREGRRERERERERGREGGRGRGRERRKRGGRIKEERAIGRWSDRENYK